MHPDKMFQGSPIMEPLQVQLCIISHHISSYQISLRHGGCFTLMTQCVLTYLCYTLMSSCPIVLMCTNATCPLRALDSELRAHIKGNDPSFELNKLAFFAEATGAVQETHILEAQNAVQNARKSSLQAGFLLFKTSLDNDQVLHERHLAAAKTDEARARSSALTSLEATTFCSALFLTTLKDVKTCCLSLFVLVLAWGFFMF